MTDIRVKTITLDSTFGSPLVVQNGPVKITDTTASTDSLTGALVLEGGLSINSTQDSSSITAGGSLTVAGGISILKKTFLGDDFKLDNNSSIFSVSGLSSDRLRIDSTLNSNITMSPDGVNTRFDLTNTRLTLSMTEPSTNPSSGSVVLFGGLSIYNTANSENISNGGSLTVAGGVSISKTAYIGLGIDSLHHANTIGNIFTRNGNVGINTTSPSSFLEIYTQDSSESFEISWNNSSGTLNNFVITVPANLTTDQPVCFSTGNSLDFIIDSQSLLYLDSINSFIGINNTDPTSTLDINGNVKANDINSNHISSTNANFTHVTSSNIVSNYFSGNSISLSGTITAAGINVPSISSSDIDVVSASIGTLNAHGNIHTLGNLFVSSNNSNGSWLGINNTSPSAELSLGSSNGSKILLKSQSEFVGLGVSNQQFNYVTPTSSSHVFYAGGSNTNGTELVRLDKDSKCINVSLISKHNSNTLGNVYTTGGNVGIGVTSPNAQLHVDNSIHASSISCSNLYASNNIENGGFDFVLGITDQTTRGDSGLSRALVKDSGSTLVLNYADDFTGGIRLGNGTDVQVSGSIKASNNANTLGNVYTTGGNVGVGVTQPEHTLHIDGTLKTNSTENSVGLGSGGSFTVLGGASISKDLYIGGNIFGPTVGSTFFSKIGVTSTENSINLSSGALVSSGGITIITTRNAQSVTNGGALLVAGGSAFSRDMYIGGNIYAKSSLKIQTQTDEFIELFDNMNIQRWNIQKDLSSHNLSINRYDGGGSFIESTFDISSNLGTTTLNNTTPSTSSVSASLVLIGGLSIGETQNASSIVNGGALTVAGGVAINKDLYVGGDLSFVSTTDSSDISSGALVILGGVAISKNLNIGGDATINGNLTVNGTISSIVSTNTDIGDNIIVLNSGPSGSRDAGFVIHRFQNDNDTATGDVINDGYSYVIDTLPSQSGMNTTQIKLSTNTSTTDDFYNGHWIKITSGFSNNQVRQIVDYEGSSHIATVSSPWTTQNPSSSDSVQIYYRSFVGTIYDEVDDILYFGSTALSPPSQGSVILTDEIPIKFRNAIVTNTSPSTSFTSGAIVLSGGIGISNTTDAVNHTNGGSITVAGGAAIAKSLYVGESFYVNGFNLTPSGGDIPATVSFSGANNQITFVDITGLSFSSNVWGFDVWMSVRINATTPLYSNFLLRGVNKNSSWELGETYIGDDTGLQFNITSAGQIQYTSPNFPGFVSLIFRFKAQTN